MTQKKKKQPKKKVIPNNFAVFILSNGRPDKVYTYSTLRRAGYTGKIFILIDNLDPAGDQYRELYGDEVIVFDKKKTAEQFDIADNFDSLRGVVYARNANFKIAEELGLKYFLQLDDDYNSFQYRFDQNYEYRYLLIRNLDKVFRALLDFFIVSGASSVAMAQGGDFIGGSEAAMAQAVMLKRKCMNSFFCSVERPFSFPGRINEDTTAYTYLGALGYLMFTVNQVILVQHVTQSNPGGLTELYLDSGTYVKSFYSVMFQPSSIRVRPMNYKNPRLHHSVAWDLTVPKILRESVRNA